MLAVNGGVRESFLGNVLVVSLGGRKPWTEQDVRRVTGARNTPDIADTVDGIKKYFAAVMKQFTRGADDLFRRAESRLEAEKKTEEVRHPSKA